MSEINTPFSVRGEWYENHSIAPFTSWRIGGPAKYLFIPEDIEDLSLFLVQYKGEKPLVWLGLGSNTLVRDQGINGVVIVTQGLRGFSQVSDTVIRAEAGVSCAQIARFAARNNLLGIEFLAGIPGTVGGALAMNAGCNGGETWEFVQKVETIDRQGELHTRTPDEFEIVYRKTSSPREEWFVASYFQLKPGSKEASLSIIKDLLARRAATQPTNLKSCGSVFKNPPGDYAARLIESADLKGLRQGGAVVSEKHANFIVNEGNATACDIEYLIDKIQSTVNEKFGVLLEKEVTILGS